MKNYPIFGMLLSSHSPASPYSDGSLNKQSAVFNQGEESCQEGRVVGLAGTVGRKLELFHFQQDVTSSALNVAALPQIYSTNIQMQHSDRQPLLNQPPSFEGIELSPFSSSQPRPLGNKPQISVQQHRPPQLYPTAVDERVIRMNGQCFREVESAPPRPKRPTGIPNMIVACSKCQVGQSVPGISSSFACLECNSINECKPMHRVFTCSKCNARVLYRVGTSLLIRCTRCREVNRVQPALEKDLETEGPLLSQSETVPNNEQSQFGKQQLEEESLVSDL